MVNTGGTGVTRYTSWTLTPPRTAQYLMAAASLECQGASYSTTGQPVKINIRFPFLCFFFPGKLLLSNSAIECPAVENPRLTDARCSVCVIVKDLEEERQVDEK